MAAKRSSSTAEAASDREIVMTRVFDAPRDLVWKAVSFVEEGRKTSLIMRMQFETVEECEKTKSFGAIEGANQTLDRLAEHLAKVA